MSFYNQQILVEDTRWKIMSTTIAQCLAGAAITRTLTRLSAGDAAAKEISPLVVHERNGPERQIAEFSRQGPVSHFVLHSGEPQSDCHEAPRSRPPANHADRHDADACLTERSDRE